jgi:hypothetical protein
MDTACSLCGRDKKYVKNVRKPEGRDQLEDLGIDGRLCKVKLS